MSRRFRLTDQFGDMATLQEAEPDRLMEQIEKLDLFAEELEAHPDPRRAAYVATQQALTFLSIPTHDQNDWMTIVGTLTQTGSDLDDLIRQIREEEGSVSEELRSTHAELQMLTGIINLFLGPEGEEERYLERRIGMLDDIEMLPLFTRPAAGDWVQLWRVDRVETTIRLCEEALERFSLNAHLSNARKAVAHIVLGNAYFDRTHGNRSQNLRKAIKHLQKGVSPTGKDRQRYPRQWALAQQSLANCYAWDQQFGKAISHYQEAYHKQIACDYDHDAAMTANNWAISLVRADQYEEAAARLVEARGRFATNPVYRAVASYNLGRVYEIWADSLQEQEEKTKREQEAVGAYVRAVYEQFRYERDIRCHAVDLAASRRLSRRRFQQKKWRNAHIWYKRTIRILEEIRGEYITEQGRYGLARQNARLYADAAYVYCQLAKEDTDHSAWEERDSMYGIALECIEQGQARLLTEMIVRNDAMPRVAEPARSKDPAKLEELLERFVHWRNVLAQLESDLRNRLHEGAPLSETIEDLRKARAEYDKVVRRIQKQIPDFMVLPRALNAKDIWAVIPTDMPTALVYFDISDHGTQVFAVTEPSVGQRATPGPGGPVVAQNHTLHIFDLDFDRSDLDQLIFGAADRAEEWQKACNEKNIAPKQWNQARDEIESDAGWLVIYRLCQQDRDFRETWRRRIERILPQLYTRLFARVDTYLREQLECKRIIFVPQLGLRLLPLHAMYDSEDGEYLVQKYEDIAYTPCAAILERCKERLRARPGVRFLGIAVGETGGQVLEDAIARIAGHFPPGTYSSGTQRIITLTGEQARENAVVRQATDRNYVAFACHGRFNLRDPWKSSLELADDDLLLGELYEKVNLPDARLVTLAACESGMSDLAGSADEFVGLPGGFLYSGAPAVVSSLWRVVARNSSELMIDTYEQIRRGMAHSQALCQAQRHALSQGGSSARPYYWAAFYYCGGSKEWWP